MRRAQWWPTTPGTPAWARRTASGATTRSYYDPGLGRFVSEAPIGLEGGINPYAFAGNDPVNNRDPSGTDLLVCRPRWGKADYTYFEGGASVTVGYDVIVGYDCAWQQSGGSDGGDGPTVGPGRGIRSPGGRITARRVLGAHLKRVGDVLGECGSARSGAAATIVGDLSFFSGTGVLIKAGKLGQGFRATSAALRNWTPTAPWLAAQLESQSSAAAASFAASRTALGASGAELGNRVQQSAMSAPGQSFKEWIKSIVPGFASATAVAAARNACQ